MGHSLYPPYSIKSLTRCSDIWTRYELFDFLFIADWKTIGEHRQRLTDCNTDRENEGRIDYDYKVGQKILVWNEGILYKAQTIWQNNPWTIMTVHTNGTFMVQPGNKLERLNIRRLKPFEGEIMSKKKVQNFLLLTCSPLLLKSYAYGC